MKGGTPLVKISPLMTNMGYFATQTLKGEKHQPQPKIHQDFKQPCSIDFILLDKISFLGHQPQRELEEDSGDAAGKK